MTNAEKYLKDGVDLEEFSESIMTWYFGNYAKANDFARIKIWAEHKIETLTEDERVILKNIDKKYSIIYRDNLGRLEVKSVEIESTIWKISMVGFNHLFKFIKNGEEYEIAELLK